jgi:hypothetical protein
MSELDARLEQSLRALVPAAGGDWGEVVSRARRLDAARARARRRLVLAFAAVALVLVTGAALAIGNQLFGWFTVSTAPEKAPTLPGAAPYVSGQTLYLAGRKPQRLAAPLLASLLGQDATLVVASPDRRRLVYHAWRDNVPLLFVHDTVSATDRLLARGAQTVAWGSDGRIAYVQGGRYRSGHAYRGRVLERTLDTRPVAWTTRPGTYEVLAWARNRLLVAVDRCLLPECNGDPAVGVYTLERSGRLVRLPLATLAALSPDGRLAIGRYDRVAGQDSPSPLVRLVDVARGRVLATLDLTRPARAAGLRGLLPGSLGRAAWHGDAIVATFSGEESALVFFRIRSGRLQVEQLVRVPAATLPGRYGLYFGAPVFAGKGADRVVVPVRRSAAGGNRGFTAVLACDRRTRRCIRGQMLAGREWFAVVSNPSRPSTVR